MLLPGAGDNCCEWSYTAEPRQQHWNRKSCSLPCFSSDIRRTLCWANSGGQFSKKVLFFLGD